MEWFKHDSNANMDMKLQEVLLDYGLEGYGLYFYCLELICGKISAANMTFQLEHDARIIARNTGSTEQKVSEMMTRFVELGLFENNSGMITCLKMLSRLDLSMTGSGKMRAAITSAKSEKRSDHDGVMTPSCKKKKEKKKEKGGDDSKIITDGLDYLNELTSSKFENVESNKKLIRARLSEGHTLETIKRVIDSKVGEWLRDPKMKKYLRPSTLFNAEKFNQYVGQLEDTVKNSGGF